MKLPIRKKNPFRLEYPLKIFYKNIFFWCSVHSFSHKKNYRYILVFFIFVLQNPGAAPKSFIHVISYRFPFTHAHLFLGYQLIQVLSMAFNEKVFFIIIFGLCQMKTKGNKTLNFVILCFRSGSSCLIYSGYGFR